MIMKKFFFFLFLIEGAFFVGHAANNSIIQDDNVVSEDNRLIKQTRIQEIHDTIASSDLDSRVKAMVADGWDIKEMTFYQDGDYWIIIWFKPDSQKNVYESNKDYWLALAEKEGWPKYEIDEGYEWMQDYNEWWMTVGAEKGKFYMKVMGGYVLELWYYDEEGNEKLFKDCHIHPVYLVATMQKEFERLKMASE